MPARLLSVVLTLLLVCSSFGSAAERPNVVMIMTDNHGAWTLGCYGNPEIKTPHIDRLAAEGTLYQRAFASNPVCSPTRATVLTGLIPSQHGVHCFLRGGGLQIGPEARNTLADFRSLPEILKDAGYACGLVGKWHLGDNLHPQESFQDYWITMPHGGTSTFYDAQIIENGQLRNEPTYLTDFWTSHARKFLEDQAKTDQPFFLFLSYNGPYSLGRLLLKEGQNRHAKYYRNLDLKTFPEEPTHPWQYSNRDYMNNPISNRRVATEVSGVDDGVGIILDTLHELGVEENTLVIFLADQGWVGGHGGFYGMGDHTRPVTATDGMMQIPLIFRHPGKIRASQSCNQMVANYDILPTILDYLQIKDDSFDAQHSPGRSFAETLQPQSTTVKAESRPVFYEFEGLRCVRTEDWKYVHRQPNGPHELYQLSEDPLEQHNLVNDHRHQNKKNQLQQELNRFYSQYASPRYDLWHGGTSQAHLFEPLEEDFSEHESETPEEDNSLVARKEFTLPPGFEARVVAAPPLVRHPTFATFDDRGRLFVCENAGVNMSAEELERELPNSIRLLTDENGDGVFDQSTVFADRMTFPMGGAWFNNALYVASPPNIWRLEDTDGDGVADKRDIIVSRFGYTGNAASIHGCFLGPDGRIYWCDGFHGHEINDESGQLISQRKGSYLFSCLPDGSDVRRFCGGGMDNPVEVDFTDTGEMLGTVNILNTRPREDCLVHWLHGGVYPHRETVRSESLMTGDFLGPVHRFGHVAISGTARYRSGGYSYRWRDNYFATQFNRGKVVRLELERDQASFRVLQREFLSSGDRDFHPTDLAEDADGSLLVVDTGGWFYRGCPTSQLAKPEIEGAIYRITSQELTPLPDPRGLRIDWENLSDAELLALLNDTRFPVREQAIRKIAQRGEKMLPLLASAVSKSDIRVRQNALWAVCQIQGAHSLDKPDAAAQVVITGLQDDRFEIALTACRIASTYPHSSYRAALEKLLASEQDSLRREAATALGRLQNAETIPALIEALKRNGISREEEHALIYALIETNAPTELSGFLNSESSAVSRGVLIAIDQVQTELLDEAVLLKLLDRGDPDLTMTCLEVYLRHAQWNAILTEYLPGVLTQLDEYTSSQREALSRLLSTRLSLPAAQSLVETHLQKSTAPESVRLLLFKAIAAADATPVSANWRAAVNSALLDANSELAAIALRIVQRDDAAQYRESLEQIAQSVEQPLSSRVAAQQLLAGKSRALADPSFAILQEALRSQRSQQALAASQVLAGSSLSTEQILKLAPQLQTVSSDSLSLIIPLFARTREPQVLDAFLNEIGKSTQLESLSASTFSDVIKGFPDSHRDQANVLLRRIELAEQQKVARIDQILPQLEGADPVRGEALFHSEKAKCGSCHLIKNKGHRIGPELTTIGANRSAHDLIESVLFPSASIVRDYETYTVIMSSGKTISGLLIRETTEAVWIQPAVGVAISIPHEEVEEMAPSTTSMMPGGLEKTMTDQELADIISFLKQLQ